MNTTLWLQDTTDLRSYDPSPVAQQDCKWSWQTTVLSARLSRTHCRLEPRMQSDFSAEKGLQEESRGKNRLIASSCPSTPASEEPIISLGLLGPPPLVSWPALVFVVKRTRTNGGLGHLTVSVNIRSGPRSLVLWIIIGRWVMCARFFSVRGVGIASTDVGRSWIYTEAKMSCRL